MSDPLPAAPGGGAPDPKLSEAMRLARTGQVMFHADVMRLVNEIHRLRAAAVPPAAAQPGERERVAAILTSASASGDLIVSAYNRDKIVSEILRGTPDSRPAEREDA